MGGRYGGSGYRAGAYEYPGSFGIRSIGEQAFKPTAPVIEMERGPGGVFSFARFGTPSSGHQLPTVFGTPSTMARFADRAVVSSAFAARLLQRALPVLRAADLIWQFQQFWKVATDVPSGLSLNLSGYTQVCKSTDLSYCETWQCMDPVLSMDDAAPIQCQMYGTIGSEKPLIPGSKPMSVISVMGLKTGPLYGSSVVIESWRRLGTEAETPAPLTNTGVPEPSLGDDPRMRVQAWDPFRLPINHPWPLPENFPYRDLPRRQLRPDRVEQREFGPAVNGGPYGLPDVYKNPFPDPWPFETAKPGEAGDKIVTDGGRPVTFRDPFRLPRPDRPRTRKVTIAMSGYGVVRLVGAATELVDLVGDLWDAIPKRECKPGEPGSSLIGGVGSGVAYTGLTPSGLCGGNVKECSGARIKYSPPLHRVPRKRFKSNGKWVSQPARGATGRPITHPRPQDMLTDLWNHWGQVDWCSAIENIADDQIKDFLYGFASRRVGRVFGQASGRPVGPATGPAM